jgi:hypothetical protein
MANQYGWAEQTAASRAILSTGRSGRTAMRGARGTVRRKARKAKRKVAAKVRRKVGRKVAGAKFKKGSAAAKAHMAKLRKMVGKRR